MRWRVLKNLREKTNSKLKKEELILETLFKNRNLISQKQKRDFLNPPNPLNLKPASLGIKDVQVKKAIERIKKAIKSKEQVIVYGDYDSDGICGTAILWETLYQMGAQVLPYIPTRGTEGYGFNTQTIKNLKENYPTLGLIISVDHGIVANQQVEFAQKNGIDVIITDHHQPSKIYPPAYAIIHTQKIAGVSVAWLLAKALGAPKEKLKGDLSLCALGTVGDVMPLVGENRGFVKYGIEELRKTERPGLLALLEIAGLSKEKIGVYEIGFVIDPRINAKGRVGNAMDSLRLLCSRNSIKAFQLAQELEFSNKERQNLLNGTCKTARQMCFNIQNKKIIFLADESFHHGIVGLVAGKLAEEFYRPAVIVSRGENFSKASARSIEGFNIVQAIRSCSDLLIDAGGHPLAAGFTIETEKLEILKQRLEEIAEKELDDQKLIKTLTIDCELSFSDLNINLYKKILEFEPFGLGNPEPVFVTTQVEIIDSSIVGLERKHLKLKLAAFDSPQTFEALGFGMGDLIEKIPKNQPINIAYGLGLDEWNGNVKILLKLKDIKWRKDF